MTNVGQAGAPLRTIASYALEVMIAEVNEAPRPLLPQRAPADSTVLAEAPGIYANSRDVAFVSTLDGNMFIYEGMARTRVRSVDGQLVTDDLHDSSRPVIARNDSLVLGDNQYRRIRRINPLPHTVQYDDYTGSYGAHPNTIHILERENGLYAHTDWINFYQLRRARQDSFVFPDYGYFNGEQLAFERDDDGEVMGAYIANMALPKLPRVESPALQRVYPEESVGAILNRAASATPPMELGSFQESNLIDLTMVDPLISLDMQLANGSNFLRQPLVQEQRAFLQQPVADALFRARDEFHRRGYGLLIHEAYHPWYVTKTFHESLPDSLNHYYASPETGSCHNRGAAVSLSLFALGTGEIIPMPTPFNTFSAKAHSDYPFLEPVERANRELLRLVMQREGFRPNPNKWWNFEHDLCSQYPVMNESFDQATSAEEISIRTRRIYTVDR